MSLRHGPDPLPSRVSRHLGIALDAGARPHLADARFHTLLTGSVVDRVPRPLPDGNTRTPASPPAQTDSPNERVAVDEWPDSRRWRLYFERNAGALLSIPWQAEPALTPAERRVISASLQEFQAGERSEGRHLYRLAQDYAARTGDAEYLRAIRLFIAEEQRHAADLGRFMTLNSIPLVSTTAVDCVFRRLRNLVPSLEVSIGVLVTAELIAMVYYAALREATHSPALRRLCDQILRDEEAHVAFQWGQLNRLRERRGAMPLAVTSAVQRLLYAGTALIVWWRHRPVLRRGRFTWWRWWAECWAEFERAASTSLRCHPSTLVSDPSGRSRLVSVVRRA